MYVHGSSERKRFDRKVVKVVVVDDSDDQRSAVEAALEEEGCLVLQARDGVEALAPMRRLFGRVIALVDLATPGTDGRALVQALEADRDLEAIPVIGWTSSRGVQVPGAAAGLERPVTVEEILTVIAERCS